MATYVNNLRLKEITTGDESGTWGTSTNTNLELIGEALGYGTLACFPSDANDTTTATVADGGADPARAMYFKVTSSVSLSATRELTIAPPEMSRVMWIENATTGSQSITIKQGSGSTVTIATGKTKIVYLDGAGGGAAVVDALAVIEDLVKTGTSASLTQLNITAQGDLRLEDSSGGEYVALQAPATVGSNLTFTLPSADGSSGQVLKTNGSGVLSFTSINTPGAAASFTQVDITAQGDLRLQDSSGGEYVAIQAPATIASNYTLTLPADDGDADQYLQTNGSGVLDWATIPSNVYAAWDTITTGTTLVAGGQYVSYASGALTHTLPSGSEGSTVTISNAGAGTVTVARNGSQKIDSVAEDGTLNSGDSVQLVYANDTVGWHSL
tara:strand:- start:81 stop:1232 length:1152 start_codon:yes stop_codon:yes gene_type:complete